MRDYYALYKNRESKKELLLSVGMRNYYTLHKNRESKKELLLSVGMRNYYALYKNRESKKKPMTVWSRLFMGSFLCSFVEMHQ